MTYKRLSIVIMIVLLSMAAAPAFPAEELFDTATAAKRMEQGLSYLKAKDYDAAIHEFEESAAINPEAEAYYYLGYTYYLKGRKSNGEDREKSRENFEKAYEIDPNFSPSRYKPTEPSPQQAVEPTPQQQPVEPAPDAEPAAPQPAAPQTPAPDQPKP